MDGAGGGGHAGGSGFALLTEAFSLVVVGTAPGGGGGGFPQGEVDAWFEAIRGVVEALQLRSAGAAKEAEEAGGNRRGCRVAL